MRQFYRNCHDWATAHTAVTGTGAFASLWVPTPNDVILKALTFVVAVATTFDLVFAFSDKANLHDALCRRFTDLSAKIVELPPTSPNLTLARVERLKIEADEPTEHRLVELWSFNDECRANGQEGYMLPLTPLQRSAVAYVVGMFGEAGIDKRKLKLSKKIT